jgi:hypothetical protein
MKGTRAWISLMAGMLLLGAQSVMSATITGSAHDFTTKTWSGGKICIACHAPHNSDTSVSDAPLWSHRNSTQTYTLYSSPTMNATMGQPGGNSKLCLSCHDGTVAVDSFGGATGTTFVLPANNLGNTLLNDHPIGFVYNTALATSDGSLFDPSVKTVTVGSGAQSKTGTVGATMLFNGKMECSSCHDVHNTFTVPAPTGQLTNKLLKVSSNGSAICLACHNK